MQTISALPQSRNDQIIIICSIKWSFFLVVNGKNYQQRKWCNRATGGGGGGACAQEQDKKQSQVIGKDAMEI
jgi:hypothetical protein